MLDDINISDVNRDIILRTENIFEKSIGLKLFTPTILLTGHKGDVYTCRNSNEGYLLASAGYDRTINIWEVFHEKCRNLTTLSGHNNAILQVCWSQDDTKLFSCSADKTVCVWDIFQSKRVKKLKGHENFVNSIDATKKGPELIVSGGDDNNIFLWDLRMKKHVLTEKFKFQITSVAFNSTAEQIFAGGVDNQVKIFDIRKRITENVLIGHTDTITGLALSNDGNYLLSNSMDHTIRCWDIRPFVHGNRCVKIFHGAVHNFEKNLLRVCWSKDDSMISAGSADRFVYIWNYSSSKVEYKFGGHTGCINETSFNNLGNVIASGSSDQSVIIGEF